MKKFTHLPAIIVCFFLFTSCQRDAHSDVVSTSNEAPSVTLPDQQDGFLSTEKPKSTLETCNPNAYTITLESKTAVTGGWEWVWSVQNPNPGNGSNGTAQDLSHWGMQFGACFSTSSMVSAGYSPDGSNWTTFNPSYAVDPSQGCMTTPVLKFDFGTQGTAKSYYKLVVNADYIEGAASGYYKSGGNTGCCTFVFTGIACADGEGPR